MPLYRVIEPGLGQLRVQVWRRQVVWTLSLLFLTLLGCTTGLLLLEPTAESLHHKVFIALWNAVNLITTMGDFTEFTNGQKTFVILTMLVYMMIGAMPSPHLPASYRATQ